jgi:glutathione S-transferase
VLAVAIPARNANDRRRTNRGRRHFQGIDRPRALSFSWGAEGDPSRQSFITLTLTELEGKTELTLRQEGLGSASNRDEHERGWNSTLNKLSLYLERERS